MTIFQRKILGIIWLLFVCWMISKIANKSYQSMPNNAEITRNRQVMEDMGLSPRLIAIIMCESGGIHFNVDGTVLRGKLDPDDTGIAQINVRYHLQKSRNLGFDIYTLEGNLGYAVYLFEHEGDRPWNSSSQCWVRSPVYIAYNR